MRKCLFIFIFLTINNLLFSQEDCDFMIEHIDKESTRKQGHYTGEENPVWEEEPVMDDGVCMLNISRTTEQKYLDKFWTAIKIADQTIYKYNINNCSDLYSDFIL